VRGATLSGRSAFLPSFVQPQTAAFSMGQAELGLFAEKHGYVSAVLALLARLSASFASFHSPFHAFFSPLLVGQAGRSVLKL